MNHTKNINQEIVDKNRLTTTDNDARIIYVLHTFCQNYVSISTILIEFYFALNFRIYSRERK